MKMVTLGNTGITVPQNAFGALPVQRRNFEDAAAILRRAYEGGMTFFDTANAYTDSEEKIGAALFDVRDKIVDFGVTILLSLVTNIILAPPVSSTLVLVFESRYMFSL